MTSIPGESTVQQASKTRTLSNLAQRMLTVAVAMPLALITSFLGDWLFFILVTAMAAIGLLEFYTLAANRKMEGRVWIGVPVLVAITLGFHLQQPWLALIALVAGGSTSFAYELLRQSKPSREALVHAFGTLVGVLYLGLPMGFLIAIRAFPNGLTWLLMVLACTWGTDSAAYVGGMLFGRHKLAPTLSPKKTFEGALVGVLGGIFGGTLVLAVGGKLSALALVLVGIAPLFAIWGDLVESGLKRFFYAKDSHLTGFNIFPGHGGVLDRIDALILVTTLAYFYFQVSGLAYY